MDGLPVMLQVRGRRCVVVGAGGVAARRAKALRACGGRVVLIAPDADGSDAAAAAEQVRNRAYSDGDLAEAMLVVIATDNAAVNDAVAAEARQRGVLINRADNPEAGDVVVLAHRRRGPVTIGVSTGGISARTAGNLAERLIEQIDDEQIAMLEAAGPWRQRVQAEITSASRRQTLLRQLVDAAALNAFRIGGVGGYNSHIERLMKKERA